MAHPLLISHAAPIVMETQLTTRRIMFTGQHTQRMPVIESDMGEQQEARIAEHACTLRSGSRAMITGQEGTQSAFQEAKTTMPNSALSEFRADN